MLLLLSEEELAYLRYALVHSKTGWIKAEKEKALVPEPEMAQLLAKVQQAENLAESLPEDPRARVLVLLNIFSRAVAEVVNSLPAGDVPALFFMDNTLEELGELFRRRADTDLVSRLKANLMQEIVAEKGNSPKTCRECGKCESEALRKAKKAIEIMCSLLLATGMCLDEFRDEATGELERLLREKEGVRNG